VVSFLLSKRIANSLTRFEDVAEGIATVEIARCGNADKRSRRPFYGGGAVRGRCEESLARTVEILNSWFLDRRHAAVTTIYRVPVDVDADHGKPPTGMATRYYGAELAYTYDRDSLDR
jgi:hypothetical protein